MQEELLQIATQYDLKTLWKATVYESRYFFTMKETKGLAKNWRKSIEQKLKAVNITGNAAKKAATKEITGVRHCQCPLLHPEPINLKGLMLQWNLY